MYINSCFYDMYYALIYTIRKERSKDKPEGTRKCHGASKEEEQSHNTTLGWKLEPKIEKYNIPFGHPILSCHAHI